MNITIIDTTLREGRQSIFSNKILSIQDKYLKLVKNIGIKDIEIYHPYTKKEDYTLFLKLTKSFPKINFFAHSYLQKESIDLLVKDKNVLAFSTSIPYPFTEKVFNVINTFLKKTKNKKIRIGIENAFSYNKSDLQKILSFLSDNNKITRIGILDTLGVASVDKIKEIMNIIKNTNLKLKDIEFHFHNDYGTAAYNAAFVMKAWDDKYGALCLSASMLGMGERNGILSFGDILVNGSKFNCLGDYSISFYKELVDLMSSNDISFQRDPLSKYYFSHCANSHIMGQINQSKYESVNPKLFGMEHQFVFSSSTGKDIYFNFAKSIIPESIFIDRDNLKTKILLYLKNNKKDFILIDELKTIIHSMYQ